MPVSINMPQRKQEADPLEKLANAVGIAKSIYGIYADSKTLDQALAKKAEEDKLRALQVEEAERKKSDYESGKRTDSPLLKLLREHGRLKGITIPDDMTEADAKSSGVIDDILKPKEEKVTDPYLAESRRLDLEKKKADLASKGQANKEFQNRYQNILTQVEEAKRMVADKGTFEALGPHNKQLQQRIDSIAIDAAKLFDPQSVARESEVAAFRNMLFEGGSLKDSNASAISLLDNFKNVVDSRAANLGIAASGNQGSQGGLGKSAGGGALPKPKTIMQNGHVYTFNPKTGEYE